MVNLMTNDLKTLLGKGVGITKKNHFFKILYGNFGSTLSRPHTPLLDLRIHVSQECIIRGPLSFAESAHLKLGNVP